MSLLQSLRVSGVWSLGTGVLQEKKKSQCASHCIPFHSDLSEDSDEIVTLVFRKGPWGSLVWETRRTFHIFFHSPGSETKPADHLPSGTLNADWVFQRRTQRGYILNTLVAEKETREKAAMEGDQVSSTQDLDCLCHSVARHFVCRMDTTRIKLK